MEKKLIRVAVVGAGFMGDKHIESYAKIPNAKVVGVIDTRIEKAAQLAQTVKAKAYSSVQDLIAHEGVDALDVCVPTSLHKENVLQGFAAGLDVLVEKPFALDLQDMNEIMSGQENSGRRLMVAHVCRFMPEYIFAKSIVDRGDLGKALFFGAWRESATPDWSWNNWLHDRQLSGGTVMDLQIHDIDISQWLLGEPEEFYAQEVMHPGAKGPSHVIANLAFRNGAMANLEAGHLMPKTYPFSTGYRLVLEKGVVEFATGPGNASQIRVFKENEEQTIQLTELPQPYGDDPYAEELKHFIDCLCTGTEFKISPEEAKLAVQTVLMLKTSLIVKQRIS